MTKQTMGLSEYMVAMINAHSADEPNYAQIVELREEHGNNVATYDEVEQGIALMTRSLMSDAFIGEQVQGVFNQSVLELLEQRGIITKTDIQNVADIMANATHQLYNENNNGTNPQEEANV